MAYENEINSGLPDPGMIASQTGMRARNPWEMERPRPRLLYMCPHCGWQYKPSSDGLVPRHVYEGVFCEGTHQNPRSIHDKRPLWKDEKQA
jgi:hypothetical protein